MATASGYPSRSQYYSAYNCLRGTAAFLFLLTAGAVAQQAPRASALPESPEKNTGGDALLWQDPTDIAIRDLRYGEGGVRDAPRTTVFAFVKEDLDGSNPKFVVTDESGKRWKIKLGAEAKPEVAASRLVWAVGYFSNEDYYLPELQITGLPVKIHRGRQLIDAAGTIRGARLQRVDKTVSKLGSWHWKKGTFTGTRELNGLRVMMARINNWDLKDINNKIDAEKNAPSRQTYIVSDLGASFGTTGFVLGHTKSRGNLKAFRSSHFITKETPQYIDFATPSRPTWIELVNPPQFFMRIHLRSIGKRIPRSDVQWIAGILSRLTPAQIRDAFAAAGYSPLEVEGFAGVIQERIASLGDI